MDKAEKIDCSANGEVVFWPLALYILDPEKYLDKRGLSAGVPESRVNC